MGEEPVRRPESPIRQARQESDEDRREGDQKDQEGRYIRQERYSGTCSRSFYVGDVQPEEINAKYDSGILMLTLPKKDQQTLPTQNRIAIE